MINATLRRRRGIKLIWGRGALEYAIVILNVLYSGVPRGVVLRVLKHLPSEKSSWDY